MKKQFLYLVLLGVSMCFAQGAQAQVTIGAETAPKSHSLLELNTSEVKAGLRLPQLTTKERDALSVVGDNSAKGLIIFNVDINCIETWSGTEWLSNCGEIFVGQPPLIIIEPKSQYIAKDDWDDATIATLSVVAIGSQIRYQWFKWDNTTSAYTEINGATNAAYVPDAVTFSPDSYYCRVYNDYGITDSKEATVIKVCQANGNSKIFLFMCHNLGADYTAYPLTPAAAIHGGKYVWGLANSQNGGGVGASQALDQSSTTITLSGTPPNTSANWNMSTQNPCPAGWRVPKSTELEEIITNNTLIRVPTATTAWTSSADNFATGLMIGESLFLPAAGFRYTSGLLGNRGYMGYYWSSTTVDADPTTRAHYLRIESTTQSINPNVKGGGFSIRCIAE